jgi:anti-anti-sigma factor
VASAENHAIAVAYDGEDVAVVTLRGEHDQFSSRRLSETLAGELEAGRDLVVDLSETAFLDSTSAGALLVADQRATTTGRRLVIALTDATPTPVVRLFDTARLRTILTVAPSWPAAVTLARQS